MWGVWGDEICMRGSYINLNGRVHLEKPRRKWENIIRMDLRE
jgi:hypothetical protein